MKLVIASYNLQGIQDEKSLVVILKELMDRDAAVIAFQEAHSNLSNCAKSIKKFDSLYVLIMEKIYTIEDQPRYLQIWIKQSLGKERNQTFFGKGRSIGIQFKNLGFTILNCHLYVEKNQNSNHPKIEEFTRILSQLDQFNHVNTLLVGDFNCCISRIHREVDDLCQGAFYKTTFPDERKCYFPQSLDRIYCYKNQCINLISNDILFDGKENKFSDHYAILSVLEFSQTKFNLAKPIEIYKTPLLSEEQHILSYLVIIHSQISSLNTCEIMVSQTLDYYFSKMIRDLKYQFTKMETKRFEKKESKIGYIKYTFSEATYLLH